ncbi:hypothetical protein BU15DRAFT_83097 [Melanogaster broomeanus]|nr:hypothetical protein BU15DRAFT_83097 [Melanogaster broomeanus]
MARAPSSRASTVSATTKVARKLSEDEINILKSQLEAWKNKRNRCHTPRVLVILEDFAPYPPILPSLNQKYQYHPEQPDTGRSTTRDSHRPAVYREVHKEAKKLDSIGNMSRDEWDIRKQAYKNWLYNHGRRKASKRLVKYGKTYTARDVIKVQKKEEIQNLIEVERGAKPGEREMIASYQWGVNQVMNGLTEEEVQEAERQAEEWRKAKPPPEVQARTALQKGERYVREFAEEMWRQCGMRVALLGTWKDRNGQIMTTQFDINEEIDDGEPFTGWGGVHQRWMDRFRCQPRPRKKKSTKAKSDPLSLVRKGDKAWIVDIKDASLEVMKQMIRGFITFHYKWIVPWMQISGQRSDYIAAKYLPEGVKLREPSKLQKKDVITILEFWRKRQSSDPEDVFCFRKWQDSTGTLQNPLDSDSDQEAAIRRRKASKGKRKATSEDGLTRKRRINSRRGTIQAVTEMILLKELSIFSGMVLGRQYPSDHRVLLWSKKLKAGQQLIKWPRKRNPTAEVPHRNWSQQEPREATSDGDDRGPYRWTSVEPEPRPMTSRASKARVSYAGRPPPELNSEEAHPSVKTKSTATKKTLGQDPKAEKKREPQACIGRWRRPKRKAYPDEATGANRTDRMYWKMILKSNREIETEPTDACPIP